MKITWLGHASFLLETADKKIITDPFDEKVGYKVYDKKVDYITLSHDHWDHNGVHLLLGEPLIINTLGEHYGENIKFEGIASYHDENQGQLRGDNIIFKICAEEINVVHLGDLGHLLDYKDINALGKVDILLIPVGGTFTIDARAAWELVNSLKPKLVIPMHYQTPHLSFALAPAEDFTRYFDIVVKKPYLEVKKSTTFQENKVILLDYLSWLT